MILAKLLPSNRQGKPAIFQAAKDAAESLHDGAETALAKVDQEMEAERKELADIKAEPDEATRLRLLAERDNRRRNRRRS